MDRRVFLSGMVALGALATAGSAMAFDLFKSKDGSNGKIGKKADSFPYELTEAEWKDKLTDEQFRVLRKAGTERSGTSELNDEKRDGIFHCAGCDHPLFSSKHKFDSGTGWPSFFQPINDEALGYSADLVLLIPRTEEHCANCGGHLGHVFNDGPQPTGKRHCINGVAMHFTPAEV